MSVGLIRRGLFHPVALCMNFRMPSIPSAQRAIMNGSLGDVIPKIRAMDLFQTSSIAEKMRATICSRLGSLGTANAHLMMALKDLDQDPERARLGLKISQEILEYALKQTQPFLPGSVEGMFHSYLEFSLLLELQRSFSNPDRFFKEGFEERLSFFIPTGILKLTADICRVEIGENEVLPAYVIRLELDRRSSEKQLSFNLIEKTGGREFHRDPITADA